MNYVVRRGTGPVWQDVEPGRSGWSWTGIRVVDLAPGEGHEVVLGDREAVVVPLIGPVTVSTDGATFDLAGRRSPFDAATDAAYVPRGAALRLEGTGRIAVATAVAGARFEPAYLPLNGVRRLARGAGSMSRLVREYAMPEAFTATSRLLVCEVVTPAGNWSGYPAHKHDTQSATESELEEIYYYEFAEGPHGEPGFGLHETTSAAPDRPIDVHAEVRTGDVALVPYGWHGPCAASPGHDMYYLNVMAGPSTAKDWRITDHPDHTWIRETWPDRPVDPRVLAGLH